jgi:hypothetical protein
MAHFDYYRCGDCAHVWSVPKDSPDDPPRHVTPLPEKLTLGSATIPIFHCPECRSSNVRLLEGLSTGSYRYFYRCHDCEHVWPIVKDSLDTDVTTVPE